MNKAAANRPANSNWVNGTIYPPPAGSSWYNGGTLEILDGWDDATDFFEFKFRVGSNLPVDGSTLRLDILSLVTAEGTAADFATTRSRGDYSASVAYLQGDYVNDLDTGIKYIRLLNGPAGIALSNTTSWREYVPTQPSSYSFSFTLKDAAARYWEVRAQANGGNIDYQIVAPVQAGATVDLTSETEPAGFMAALAAATSVADTPMTLVGNRLTATANAQKTRQTITFSVPKSGTGRHRLAIANDGNSVIAIAETCAFYTAPPRPADPAYTVGVNLSTGEFGTDPGDYGVNYIYPARPENGNALYRYEYMQYLWNLGVRTIRLPIKWGRIQHEPYADLYGEKPAGVAWSNGSWDIARIDDIIAWWTSRGGIVLLDLHNFGGTITGGGKVRYDTPLTNPNDLPIEGFIDVWVKLANRYKTNTNVWFGLMNEPNSNPQVDNVWSPSRCRAVFQTTVNAIRGRTGATNKITVPGAEYSSTTNWVANGQAAAYDDFYDPLDNFAFETHLYQDPDTAGHSGYCVLGAPARPANVTAWARSRGFKLFMGEIAGGDPTNPSFKDCGTTTPQLYTFMRDNKDVWLGWTTWGYGPWWPASYFFVMNPTDRDYQTPGPMAATMAMLLPFIAHEF